MTVGVLLVGNPIQVEKCEKPSLEEVKRVQARYIAELTRYAAHVLPADDISCFCSIWNTYKDEFAKARLRELSIID